jgi:hypothetical protein
MQDRADPHAGERAFEIASRVSPPAVSFQTAVVTIAKGVRSIGDACPECASSDEAERH